MKVKVDFKERTEGGYMKHKETLFFIIVFLVGLYLVLANTLPRYEYIDDQTPNLLRFDRVKGVLQVSKESYKGKWYKVASKAVAKVERPTITYDEFMGGEKAFQDFIKTAK